MRERVGRVPGDERVHEHREVAHRLLVVRLGLGERVRVGGHDAHARQTRPRGPMERDGLDRFLDLPHFDGEARAAREQDHPRGVVVHEVEEDDRLEEEVEQHRVEREP